MRYSAPGCAIDGASDRWCGANPHVVVRGSARGMAHAARRCYRSADVAPRCQSQRAPRAHRAVAAISAGCVSQSVGSHTSAGTWDDPAGDARLRLSPRRTSARRAVAHPRSARGMDAAHRDGPACDVAWPFHAPGRDRRRSAAHRSGMGRARVAGRICGPAALSTDAGGTRCVGARRCRARLARSLRSPRSHHGLQAGTFRCGVCHVTRCRSPPRGLGNRAGGDCRAGLVGAHRGSGRVSVRRDCRRPGAALLGPWAWRSQPDVVVVFCDTRARALVLFRSRLRAYGCLRRHRLAARSI